MLKYRDDIDGLRAVAVLSVLVFHFDLVPAGKAGFMGVDVFFVISGFLITSIIKRQLDEGTFSLKDFYLNRIRRLAPALLAILLLVTVAGAYWLFPSDFQELARQVLFSQAYLANFYYWRSLNYFGLGADSVFLLHTWSLAVEEQFYLVYPLVVMLVHRYLKRYFWAALAVGFAMSFGLNILFVESKPEATFYLLPTRAWELLAGGLIPVLSGTLGRTKVTSELLGVLGAILILLGFVLFNEEVRFPGYFALLPTFGAVSLILSGTNGGTWTSRLLSFPPVVYIGKISYSLYLVHWPVNVFATKLMGDGYSTPWRLALFSFCFLVAAAVYHAIENPFRRRIYLASSASLMSGYLAGLTLTLMLFVTVQVSDGLPGRFPDEVLRIARHASDQTPPLPCQHGDKRDLDAASFCRIGTPGRTPDWLFYGDSHAWAAYAVFDKWLHQNGKAGLFIFHAACPPLSGIHLFHDRGSCFAFNQAVFSFLERNREIRNVFMVSTWRQAIEGYLSISPDVKLSKEQSTELFAAQFSATVESLNRLGKQIYVWEPVPGARRSVPEALARAVLNNRPADIEIGLDEYTSTYEFFFSALERSRGLIAMSFSPSKALCKSGRCASTLNGVPFYFDNGHIASSSADFWVQEMDNQYKRDVPARPTSASQTQ